MKSDATAAFIRKNADADVRQLALRGTKDPEVDLPFALDQIAGRQTARQKLPSWAAVEDIIYPPHLSMEQCSSELTARYKAQISGFGDTMVDLTGGFGVDFSFMAQGFARSVYVERQEHLCDIARENFRLLGLHQAEVVCGDSVDYLQTMSPVDIIYMDPARRDSHGGRTYDISDCTPDVLSLRDLLTAKARRVLIKLSPMLDWRKAVSDIGEAFVSEVHIVSVANECKELLVLVDGGWWMVDSGGWMVDGGWWMVEGGGLKVEGEYSVRCVNLQPNSPAQVFSFNPPPSTLHQKTSTIHNPPSTLHQHYLYEPNASIMKAGCFAEVAERFGVAQVAQNSHLFTSAEPVEDFPGRSFQIEAVTSMNKRELKQHLQGLTQANIAVRNFPLSVAELRRRLKLGEGGDVYIFATTLEDKSHALLITRRRF